MRRSKTDPIDESLNRLYEIVSDHLQSLPEDEALKRLESMNGAYARKRGRDSKIRAVQPKTVRRSSLCHSR